MQTESESSVNPEAKPFDANGEDSRRQLTYPPGHSWRDKWNALSGPLLRIAEKAGRAERWARRLQGKANGLAKPETLNPNLIP